MLGVRVARVPAALTVTVAGTSAVLPAARRRKVLVVIEAAFIRSEERRVGIVWSGTSVASGDGACAVSVGATSVVKLQREAAPSAVTVGATSVVKLQRESAPSAVPLVSVTAAATVAV